MNTEDTRIYQSCLRGDCEKVNASTRVSVNINEALRGTEMIEFISNSNVN